jgi:hypothetical protein
VVGGFVLCGLGIALDREWLVGFGLVAVMLGVVLPRIRGSLEAGPSGFKVGEIIDPSDLRQRIRDKGRHLPSEAVERAEHRAQALLEDEQSGQSASDRPSWWRRDRGVPLESANPRLGSREILTDYFAEGVLTDTARREWRVAFSGALSDTARSALDRADDVVLVGGHTNAEVESHTVIVNAATANEAVNSVRSLLDDQGVFGGWEATPDLPSG